MHRGRLAAGWVLLLALVFASTPAAASHAADTLPATRADPRVDDAVAWLETHATEEGCVVHPQKNDGACTSGGNAWAAMGLAAAGVDLGDWPDPDHSLRGWFLDSAGDLWDSQYERRCESPQQNANCRNLAALSLSKSILALRAAGLQPGSISLPDGGERDFVAELLGTYENGQFGGEAYINDDIWAIIALDSVGYAGEEVDRASDYVAAHQGPSGGVGYGADQVGTSPDSTGAALIALAPREYPLFQANALDYLENTQVEEGAHRGCWSGSQADSESTVWAALGVLAAGEDLIDWSIDGQTPTGCLFTTQCDNGAFKSAAGPEYACSFYATMQALAGASWVPFGQLTEANTQAHRDRSAEVNETISLAQAPDERIRIGNQTHESHAFTAAEEGSVTFHGLAWEPYPRTLTITVHVQPEAQGTDEAGDTGGEEDQGASPGGGSDSEPGGQDGDGGGEGMSGEDDGEGDEQPPPPAVVGWELENAERNVSLETQLFAEAGDAPVTGYRVDWGDGTVTDWEETATLKHVYDELGTITATAWVRDDEDRVSEPAEAQLEIVDATPHIEILGPEEVDRGQPATLTANAVDPDGPTPAIAWEAGQATATGANATFRFDDPGLHVVEAQAIDKAGNRAWATHHLVVENQPPANLSLEPAVIEANKTTVLLAQASDPEGDELGFTWRTDTRTARGPRLSYEAGAPGNDTLGLTVSDEHGAWTQAEILLRIVPDPDAHDAANNNTGARTEETGTGSHGTTPTTETRANEAPQGAVELPDTVGVSPVHETIVAGSARCEDGNVEKVKARLNGPVPVRGTASFEITLPASPPAQAPLQARAACENGAWGPWTNATVVLEPGDVGPDGREENASAPVASGQANEHPVPTLGPMLAALTAILVAGRQSRRA